MRGVFWSQPQALQWSLHDALDQPKQWSLVPMLATAQFGLVRADPLFPNKEGMKNTSLPVSLCVMQASQQFMQDIGIFIGSPR